MRAGLISKLRHSIASAVLEQGEIEAGAKARTRAERNEGAPVARSTSCLAERASGRDRTGSRRQSSRPGRHAAEQLHQRRPLRDQAPHDRYIGRRLQARDGRSGRNQRIDLSANPLLGLQRIGQIR